MNEKSILIVTSEFPPQPGGIGNHAYNLALQLVKNGFEVVVIADQRSSDGGEEALFDRDLPFLVNRIPISSPRFLMYVKRLVVLFKMIKKSHHVMATGKFSLWSVGFASLFHGRNYLAIVHGTEVNFKGIMLRKSIDLALRRFTHVIAVSHFTKKLIAHLQLEVTVIPNGHDPEKWRLISNEIVHLAGNPKLMTVGNVSARKGQQNVIRMLPNLIQRFPELHYHCIGLPTEMTQFKKLADDLQVASHVSFHGRIDDTLLRAMLLETDIFVMLSSETSTGDVEGFGIAILEANALGVPAIGAQGCGIEDAIQVGVSGLLVDPMNGTEFVEAVEAILNDRATYGIGAKEWARKHEWGDIVKQYIRVLDTEEKDL